MGTPVPTDPPECPAPQVPSGTNERVGNWTAGALPASPFLQDQTSGKVFWGPHPTLIGQALFLFNLFPLETQLRPARSFRQKALYLTKKWGGGGES